MPELCFEQKSDLVIPMPQRKRPEITMAPLIDIVFLLLIFFMVTTVFPDDKGIVIEKPEAAAVQSIKDIKLAFDIDRAGKVYLHGNPVTPKDVERIVSETVKKDTNVVVLLNVDKKATTEIFVKVMDAAKLGGARQMGISGNEYKND